MALNNGHLVPDDILETQQALADRLYSARAALALLREEPALERPGYLDVAPST